MNAIMYICVFDQIRRLAIIVLLLLSGCAGDSTWYGTDITGILPDLEFQLVNEDGVEVTEERFRGEAALVFFGYTHCPDICPITMGKVSAAIAQLPEARQNDLHVLFISVDPKRDSPQRLSAYTSSFGPQFIGLTGSKAYLKELTKHYRATFSYAEPDDAGNYAVSHPSALYVFDAEGDARLLLGFDDSVEHIAADLKQLMG